MDYLRPVDLDEAIRLRQGTGFALLAGGTDLYPAIEHGRRCAGLIDLSRVDALRGPVRIDGGNCILPALTTWDALRHAALPPLFDALKTASGEIGGRQIQNTGTLGGNLCNASPAADGNAVLLALDASVLLAGPAGRRELPLGDFLLGNRRTALQAGERKACCASCVTSTPRSSRRSGCRYGAGAMARPSASSVHAATW